MQPGHMKPVLDDPEQHLPLRVQHSTQRKIMLLNERVPRTEIIVLYDSKSSPH